MTKIMTRQIQKLLMGLMALVVTLTLGIAPSQAKSALGGYQDFLNSEPETQSHILLSSLGNLSSDFNNPPDSLNAPKGTIAPSRGSNGYYDPQEWRKYYDDFYNGNVTSTTVPPFNGKNVKLAGQRHPDTGVVYDQRGFPIFDDVAKFDTRFTGSDFKNASYQTQMRMSTRDLRTTIQNNQQLRSQFDPDQLQAIESGKPNIPRLTWHHHQDSGRMQLVPRQTHKDTGHIGGDAMAGGQ